MTTADNTPVPDFLNLLRLDGKGYIVLGAGQGIGRQTAHALAQAGAKVFCVDLDATRAEEVATEVKGIAWSADCTRRADMQNLVDEAASRMGRIDGFVDIIGVAMWGDILDMDDEHWDRQFDLVLRHAYLASQIAGRRMKDTGGGTMTFVSSLSAQFAAVNHAGYGAAKAALESWVRSLALELAPFNIRANAVTPGTTATPRVLAMMKENEWLASRVKRIPLGRMTETADIAAAALFLSSPMSRQITGRTLLVDGGVAVKYPNQD